MILAHKIALDPNNVHETYFRKAAGTARFACNWAWTEWQRQDDAWKADSTQPKPSEAALRRHLNTIKGHQFPWMQDVTKNAPLSFTWVKRSRNSLRERVGTQRLRKKASTTALPSRMISLPSKGGRCASRSGVGCECTNSCDLSAKCCPAPSFGPPTAGF